MDAGADRSWATHHIVFGTKIIVLASMFRDENAIRGPVSVTLLYFKHKILSEKSSREEEVFLYFQQI